VGGLSRPINRYAELAPGAPVSNLVNPWECTTEGWCWKMFDSSVLIVPAVVVALAVLWGLWALARSFRGPQWQGWALSGGLGLLLLYVIAGWALPQAADTAHVFDSLMFGIAWRTVLHLVGAALIPVLLLFSYSLNSDFTRKGTLGMTAAAVGVLLGVRWLVGEVPDLATPLAERVDGLWREVAETWTLAVPLGFIDTLVQWGTQPGVIVAVAASGVLAAAIKPIGFLATPVSAVVTAAIVLVVGAAVLLGALMALIMAGAVFAWLSALLMFGLAVSWVAQK